MLEDACAVECSARKIRSVVVVVVVFLVEDPVEVFGEDHATLNIGCGVSEVGQHLLDDLGPWRRSAEPCAPVIIMMRCEHGRGVRSVQHARGAGRTSMWIFIAFLRRLMRARSAPV